jgi:predicted RNase H-like HicB family nuclease
MREYAVVFGQTRTGWSAYVPDLPGLAAVGSSYEETEQLMREAINIHLASMREDGDPIPEPTTRIGIVMVDIPERKLAKSA